MDRDDIFRAIQSSIRDMPLLVIGSGYSATHDLPGMKDLGKHLLTQLDHKYRGTACWDIFCENIEKGEDLETALSGVTLTPEILADVKCETWNLISASDLKLFERIIFENESLPLSRLLKKLCQAHPRTLNIITTNYDRIIEYACDAIGMPVVTGFEGEYLKRYSGKFCSQNAVNLLKVHGSLDVFQDAHNTTISLPMLRELRPGLIPEIITPGRSKYEAILEGTPRYLLVGADERIQRAESFLCIGYGFNDTQVQARILTQVRAGIPIVVLTRTVHEHTARLLANNAKHYISIQKGPTPNTTEICIDKAIEYFDGTFWTVDGLMEIID